MGELVLCGICGGFVDEDDEESKRAHDFRHRTHNDLEIPAFVRDVVRRWAEWILRTPENCYPLEVSQLRGEKIVSAMWVTAYMWYNEEHRRWKSKEEAFAHYEKELRKRYPLLRGFVPCMRG